MVPSTGNGKGMAMIEWLHGVPHMGSGDYNDIIVLGKLMKETRG